MTRRSTPRFRVAPPTLEPGPVLLHQLAELSASSSPAVRTARYAGARALAGAATIAVIGATTWVAGAAPGNDVTVGPAQRSTHAPTSVPSAGEGVVGTPQSDDDATSVPGSPWSPGLPGHETSTRTRGSGDAGPAREPGLQPPVDHPGKGLDEGKGDGTGNGPGRGHAFGHDKAPGHSKAKDHDRVSGPHRTTDEAGHGTSQGQGKAKGHHKSGHKTSHKTGHGAKHGSKHGVKRHGKGKRHR